MSQASLRDLSLVEFSARLSEKTPTPGGGSVAAHLLQLGAGLGSMVFRFTSGEKYAAVEQALRPRVEELDNLRARAAELIDEDARAYDLVTAAYRLPKATDAEKSARSAAVQSGLRSAMAAPSRTLELALQALRALAAGAPDINPNLASDCASAAWCLQSACEAAYLNVRINAGSLADKAAGAERSRASETELREARLLADAVRAATDKKLG